MKSKKPYFGIAACVLLVVFLYTYEDPAPMPKIPKKQGPQRDDQLEIQSRFKTFFKAIEVVPSGLACNTTPDPGVVRNKKEAVCAFNLYYKAKDTFLNLLNIPADAEVFTPELNDQGLYEPYIPIACASIFSGLKIEVVDGTPGVKAELGNSWYIRGVYFNIERGIFCVHVGA